MSHHKQNKGKNQKNKNQKKKNLDNEKEPIYDIYGRLANKKTSRNTIEYNEEARL